MRQVHTRTHVYIHSLFLLRFSAPSASSVIQTVICQNHRRHRRHRGTQREEFLAPSVRKVYRIPTTNYIEPQRCDRCIHVHTYTYTPLFLLRFSAPSASSVILTTSASSASSVILTTSASSASSAILTVTESQRAKPCRTSLCSLRPTKTKTSLDKFLWVV